MKFTDYLDRGAEAVIMAACYLAVLMFTPVLVIVGFIGWIVIQWRGEQ